MRVISGTCRGRKLIPIKGREIRPTSDRVKEAVFNILGTAVMDAMVLDLFSGTGALGIEALSRGAAHAVFVDADCRILSKNIAHCQFQDRADIVEADILSSNGLERLAPDFFDLVFIDPPYGKGYLQQVIKNKALLSRINEKSLIIAEHAAKEKTGLEQTGLDIFRQKKYSKTMISFLRQPQIEGIERT